MTLDTIYNTLPTWAKDVKLNLQSALTGSSTTELTSDQLWGSALAASMALRQPQLLAAIDAEAQANLSETNYNAAKTAASLMGMTNIYYRSLHHMSDKDYATMPAGIRMNSMRSHGADHVDFDLWALAASVIGNCGGCINAHDKQAKDGGITKGAIQSIIRLASVLHAAAVVLDTAAAEAQSDSTSQAA